MSSSVCVVGLGAAGLVCVKELREHGFDVTGIDFGKHVGGRWALDDWTCDTSIRERHFGVWKELYMDSSRPLLEFSDFAWNKQDYMQTPGVEQDLGGQYPHCSETRAYLEAYVKHFDILSKDIELETMVESVERQGDGWIVQTKRKTPGSKSVRRHFDFLVLCLGLHALPKNPLVEPGGCLNDFTGHVLHSSELISLPEMDGKRVLVVGSSISGVDLSSSLADRGRCSQIVTSVRRVPYIVDRFSPVDDMPIDQLMSHRLLVWFNRYLPDSFNASGLKAFVLQAFPDQLTADITGDASLVPDQDITKAGVTVTTDFVKHVKEAKVKLKPQVHSSSGKTVTFQDGSTQDFDVVICATGYNMDLSILPEDLRDQVAFVNPYSKTLEVALYKYTLVPGYENLAFAGQFNIIGAHFPTAEMQARYIVKAFKGDRRPSDATLTTGVEQFKAFRNGGPHHALELATKIQEDIGDELGVTPSVLSALWNARRLLFGTIFPCYYRTNPKVDNPQVAQKARELFDSYSDNPNQFVRSENTR